MKLFTRYVAIGGICFAMDFSLLRALISAHDVSPVIAATIAFVAANAVHFVLNKWWNFRSHDRELHEQFGTYLAVLGLCLAITIGTIEVLGHFGVGPLVAKVIAVAINLPIGFLGHRFLTFRSRRAPGFGRTLG